MVKIKSGEEIKMLLYHGTLKSRGEQILKDGKIDCHAKRLYEESYKGILENCLTVSEGMIIPNTLATTPGYIYCTNSLIYAIYYGNKHAIQHDENEFYIFKFDILEHKLEPDEDEVRMVLFDNPSKYPTAAATLEACKSARYGSCISEFKYCILPSTHYFDNEHSNLIRNVVSNYAYNPQKSNEYERKYIEKLLNELSEIIDWR